jgi:hypothetical protein
MRVVVHAGLPKTGTTALQSFLAGNAGRLRDLGVLYPRNGRYSEAAIDHLAFFLSFLKFPPRYFVLPFQSNFNAQEQVDMLRSEIEYFKPKTVILSCENLYSLDFNEDIIRDIGDKLKFAEEVKVYAMVRRPSDILPSMYAQSITGRRRAGWSPQYYLKLQEERGAFDYPLRLGKFAKVFGEDNLVVRDYTEVGSNVVGPLATLADFHPGEDWMSVSRENRRLSWPLVHLMRLTNRLPAGRKVVDRTLRGLDRRLPRGGWWDRLEAPFRPYSTATLRDLDRRYAAASTRPPQ